MLKVIGLAKRMGGRDVLGGVTFEVGEGETALVVGENGAGKSTLLRVLGGLLRPDAGEAWLLGNRLTRDEARFKAQLGYVPDSTDAFPELRTGEYLALVAGAAAPSRHVGRAPRAGHRGAQGALFLAPADLDALVRAAQTDVHRRRADR